MSRKLLTIPIAICFTALMFAFMSWMVNIGGKPASNNGAVSFDMLMVENEQAARTRHRELPDPPKKPVAPTPPSAKSTPSQPNMNIQSDFTSQVSLPSVDVSSALNGVSVQVPSVGKLQPNMSQSQQSMPVSRVQPNYPSRALRRNIEGYVVVKFDIDKEGKPINITVVKSEPKRIFDREAIRAVSRWKYRPNIEDGVATVVHNQQTKVEFRIAK